MWNHRKRVRQRERGEERWTEVRIETSFHLASLMAAMIVSTTKRLMVNDSNRKSKRERETGRERRERGERYYFHSDAFSHTGVMFCRPRQQDSSVI